MLQKTTQIKSPVIDTVQAISQHISDSKSTVFADCDSMGRDTRTKPDCEVLGSDAYGGSQRSFIREVISKALNLPVVGEEILNLHTFVSATQKRITCSVCPRNLKTQRAVELELLETPQVSTATKLKVLAENMMRKLHDKGLQLADVPVMRMEMKELEILIGSEHYWKIVRGWIETE